MRADGRDRDIDKLFECVNATYTLHVEMCSWDLV